jgi:hypothetical protein
MHLGKHARELQYEFFIARETELQDKGRLNDSIVPLR